VVEGTVNPSGLPTNAMFQFGETLAYGGNLNVNLTPANGWGSQPVSATITGLEPGKTYHYRLMAQNGAGQTAGDDAVFTVPGATN
jgi:hypothetical protein